MSRKYNWGVQKKHRRYIEVWIFFLLLFSVSFFELIPIMKIIGTNGPFAFTMLTLFFCFTFNRRAWIRDSKNWLVPFWWYLAGILLSLLPAQIYYGQSFGQSFFTYRRMFQLLSFPIFIAIQPTEKELRKALQAFSVVYLIAVLLVTFVVQDWALLGTHEDLVEKGDYVHDLEGMRILSVAFIFSLHRLMKEFSQKNLLWTLFTFGVMFLVQNRTSLFAIILLALYAIFSMRASSRKIIMIALIGITALVMFAYTSGQWVFLLEKTTEQLINPEYNRNKALVFVFSHREWYRYLLGDGYISANVNPIIPVLQESGIFFSDIGLFGMWYQFGVIPVLVILVMAIKAFTRQKSFLVKALALYILIGAPTMSYFALSESLLVLSLYLFVYFSDGSPKFDEPVTRSRFKGWRAYRFRSIS